MAQIKGNLGIQAERNVHVCVCWVSLLSMQTTILVMKSESYDTCLQYCLGHSNPTRMGIWVGDGLELFILHRLSL